MQRDEDDVDPSLALDDLEGFRGGSGGGGRTLDFLLKGGRQAAVLL